MTESEETFFFSSASAEGISALFQLRIYLESFLIVLSWISIFNHCAFKTCSSHCLPPHIFELYALNFSRINPCASSFVTSFYSL